MMVAATLVAVFDDQDLTGRVVRHVAQYGLRGRGSRGRRRCHQTRRGQRSDAQRDQTRSQTGSAPYAPEWFPSRERPSTERTGRADRHHLVLLGHHHAVGMSPDQIGALSGSSDQSHGEGSTAQNGLSRHRCGCDLAMRTVEGLVERGFRDTP